MKKIFMLFLFILSILCLLGCKKEIEKVKVNFIIDDISNVIEIEKGAKITNDLIPVDDFDEYEYDLYYDYKYKNKYNDEEINKDIDIYIKKIEKVTIEFIYENTLYTLKVRKGNKNN